MQLSIHGAYPSLSAGDLEELGWDLSVTGGRCGNLAKAVIENGIVGDVTGDCLMLDGCKILQVGQVLSDTKIEIFRELRLFYDAGQESKMLGQPVAPRAIAIPLWGLNVSFDNNHLQAITLSEPAILQSRKDGAFVSWEFYENCRQEGMYTVNVVPTVPEDFDVCHLSIEGIRPGQPVNDLEALGWELRCQPSGDDNRIYVRGDDPECTSVMLSLKHGKIQTVTGGKLLEVDDRRRVLQSEVRVAENRREVFRALGLAEPEREFEPLRELGGMLCFTDLGLEVSFTNTVRSIQLRMSPLNGMLQDSATLRYSVDEDASLLFWKNVKFLSPLQTPDGY